MSPLLERRELLTVMVLGGAGLALGAFELAELRRQPVFNWPRASLRPSAWYRVEDTGNVVVFLARAEMGQGVTSTLPMLVAEELDVDWASVMVQNAPLEPEFGRQSTTASMSVFTAWEKLRAAGAAGREMLRAAA